MTAHFSDHGHPFHADHGQPARVKVVVASVMQPSAETAWRWQPG